MPELEPREGEVVVDKITMSAFEGTFLNLAMRDAGIDSFLIAGIALEIGIEPTAQQGLDLNYLPVVITDACGWKTEELLEASVALCNVGGNRRGFYGLKRRHRRNLWTNAKPVPRSNP